MKSKHIAADTEAQIYVIILDLGEEAFAALTASPMKREFLRRR